MNDQDAWSEELDVAGCVGSVTVHLSRTLRCAADWGGWQWMADGLDEDHAKAHLRQRLERLDPFFGGPDYGPYGFPAFRETYQPMLEAVEELSERIPEPVRNRIRGYVKALEERWDRDYPS